MCENEDTTKKAKTENGSGDAPTNGVESKTTKVKLFFSHVG